MRPNKLDEEIFRNELSRLTYDDTTLSVENTNVRNIRALFNNVGQGRFSTNSVTGDNCFRLGWDTVALFEVSTSGFKLIDIKVLNDAYNVGSRKASEYCGSTFNQVVTRAVYTCTFAYLKSGNNVVLAHLDLDYQQSGLAEIQKFLPPELNKYATGLCSRARDESGNERRDFYDGLIEAYGNNDLKCCIRHEYGEGDVLPYYGHFEIGVYLTDRNEPEIFGDFTFEPYSQEKTTSVKIFSSVNELWEYALEHMNKRRGGGGCCTIL